jgi:hypothetical protein
MPGISGTLSQLLTSLNPVQAARLPNLLGNTGERHSRCDRLHDHLAGAVAPRPRAGSIVFWPRGKHPASVMV